MRSGDSDRGMLRIRPGTLGWRNVVALPIAAFCLMLGSAEAQQLATVWGTVQTKRAGRIDATVQVMDSNSEPKVVRKSSPVIDGRYRIDHVEEGSYDIAACAGLKYEPKIRKGVRVPPDDGSPVTINFVLEDPQYNETVLNLPQSTSGKPMLVFFKHKLTGCEAAPIRTDEHGRLSIYIDSVVLSEFYDFCFETADRWLVPRHLSHVIRKASRLLGSHCRRTVPCRSNQRRRDALEFIGCDLARSYICSRTGGRSARGFSARG